VSLNHGGRHQPQKTRAHQITQQTGLRHVDVGAPLPVTAERAKGYNISLVAVLEKPEDALVYAEHPAHEKYAPFPSRLSAQADVDMI
jgi:hypothetical protein